MRGDPAAQPDHPRVGRVLPRAWSLKRCSPIWTTISGTLTYRWALRAHPNKPKKWVVCPLLRPVQPVQAGPMDLRRPRQRRLPPPVRLDNDRPSPTGHGHRVYRRPRPRPVLGRASRKTTTALGGSHRHAAAHGNAAAARPAAPTAARRPRTTKPTRMGAVDQATKTIARQARRAALTITTDGGQTTHRLLHSRLPPPRTAQQSGTSTFRTRRPRGLLEPDAVKVARPVLRGPGRCKGVRATRPTISCRSGPVRAVR